LFPNGERVLETMWEATFHADGGVRAAEHGSGLLLSRTQPRPPTVPGEPPKSRPTLTEIQTPIVEAYIAKCKETGTRPRIGLSRSVYVAATREEAMADAVPGAKPHAERVGRREGVATELTPEEVPRRVDVH